MWKCIGIFSLLGGTAGLLYNWSKEEKEKIRRLEAVLRFLEKSVYVMQREKIKLSDWFAKYIEQELSVPTNSNRILACSLREMTRRLSANTYPNGQMVWEEVFKEEEQNLNFDHEVFQCIVQAGCSFFGRSREENVSFLQKSIRELEQHRSRMIKMSAQERKVWIPVGMLGAVMLVIFFL